MTLVLPDQPPAPDAPALILLVGMHRSGTSLLGSLLPPLGVALPGDLIGADHHNPEGYFERSDITALQENLLIALGRWWPSAAGADPLPDGWLEHPASRRAATHLQQLLAAELRQQEGPWAIKDPRTSLLLPLWRQVAAELQLPLQLVLSVRDPAEVMVSLLQRDAATTGMTASRAQHLWWHHNRELLLAAQDLPLLVVDYSAWFEPRRRQRQLQQLARFCLTQPARPAALTAAAQRIQPAHRRSRRHASQWPQPLHPWLHRLHKRLQQLARAGTPARQRQQLQQWLLPSRHRLPPVAAPGPWFDPQHYRLQAPTLPAWLPAWPHYCMLGWRHGRSPHPLFETNHYVQVAHQRGLNCTCPPLKHFLRSGTALALPPSALAEPRWAASSPARLALLQQARLEGLHPWGQAALAVCCGQQQAAIAKLRQWLQEGLDATDLAAIAAAPLGQWSGTALCQDSPPPLPDRAKLVCIGTNLSSWQVHARLQHLPLTSTVQLDPQAEPTIHLLVGPLPEGQAALQLIPLAGEPWVFTSEASSLPILQRLGISAQPMPAGPGQ